MMRPLFPALALLFLIEGCDQSAPSPTPVPPRAAMSVEAARPGPARVPFNPALFPGLRAENSEETQIDRKLTRAEQRDIYFQAAAGDSRAEDDAERAYPDGPKNAILTPNEQKEKAALVDRLTGRYRLPVAREYHLSTGQLQRIVGKGVEQHWPAPPD